MSRSERSARACRCTGLLLALALTAGLPARARSDAGVAPLAQYTRVSWTETEGLSASQVWAMVQDRDGYLWLGTDTGLIRFDGVRFVPWSELNRPPLVNSSVRSLLAAADGSLWIGQGGSGGVARYHDGAIVHYGADDGIHHGEVSAFLEEADGTIWVGQQFGLSRFRGGRWERLDERQGIPEIRVRSLFAGRGGTLWVATPGGIYRRVAGRDRFELFSPEPGVDAFADDTSGRVWATGSKLDLQPLDDPPPTRIDANRRAPGGARLLRDRDGSFWIGTLGDGLIRAHVGDAAPPDVQRLRGEGSLSSDVVRCLLEDREGNVWVGTQRGLNRISKAIFSSIPSDGYPPMNRYVSAVARGSDGSMWVATADGVYRSRSGGWTRYDRRDGLPAVRATALYAAADGTVWIATQNGLARFAHDVVTTLPGADGLANIHALTSDPDGAIWICDTQAGLFRLDPRTGALQRISGVAAPFSAYTARDGRVWIGSFTGTVHASGAGGWQSYSRNDGLVGGSITAIAEDSDGSLWFGSVGGLSRLAGNRFVTLTGHDGLPGSIVQAIAEVDGDLWLGLNSGIARVKRADLEAAMIDRSRRPSFTLYDSADGLRGTPIGLGQPLVARADDGRLWFTTSDGVSTVDPLQAVRRRLPPPVRIESALADDRPLASTPELRLPPRTANVQIDYTALSFVAPAKIRFRYRLDGFDTSWIDAGTRRRAFYTNLPPGSYRFRVAADNGGVWSKAEAEWRFSIAPAFSQTPWFYGLLALAAAAVAALAWQARVHQVRQSFALVLSERTRVAREIHDTLLQGLVGVAIHFDGLAADIESSPRAAVAQFERLRKEVELYIREARQSIVDLRSPMLGTRDLAAALRETGERIASGAAARFEFRTTGTPRVRVPRVEEQLLRIGQEAVSNAVRHARAALIQMELAFDEDRIVLRVTDDGRGFDLDNPEQHISEHWGLASMQERTEQIGGRFRVMTSPGRGTEIEAIAFVAAKRSA